MECMQRACIYIGKARYLYLFYPVFYCIQYERVLSTYAYDLTV